MSPRSQAGQIQFLFIYKSAAVSDGLNFIALDCHVNLGSPSLGSFYSQFSYTDSAGKTTGAPIILCITVPLSAVNTGGGPPVRPVRGPERKVPLLLRAAALHRRACSTTTSRLPPPSRQLVTQGLIADSRGSPVGGFGLNWLRVISLLASSSS